MEHVVKREVTYQEFRTAGLRLTLDLIAHWLEVQLSSCERIDRRVIKLLAQKKKFDELRNQFNYED